MRVYAYYDTVRYEAVLVRCHQSTKNEQTQNFYALFCLASLFITIVLLVSVHTIASYLLNKAQKRSFYYCY